MIPLDQFLQHVKAGTIPSGPPIGSSPGGRDWYSANLPIDEAVQADVDRYSVRRQANLHGMWAIVDQVWTKELARWIGKRRVLEIMAGAGWLAKALHGHGVDIIATDSYEWNEQHSLMKHVYPVEELHDLAAIIKYNKWAQVILCSWPPYGSDAIVGACQLWGRRRPIVYIGEGEGGCNAPDEFFQHFRLIEPQPSIPLMAWSGIHDRVEIGKWT